MDGSHFDRGDRGRPDRRSVAGRMVSFSLGHHADDGGPGLLRAAANHPCDTTASGLAFLSRRDGTGGVRWWV